MPSPIDIVNYSLDMINIAPLQDLDATDAKAQKCRRIYEMAKLFVMGKEDWNGSHGRVEIEEDATAPINEWGHAYTWPADCVKPTRLNDDDYVSWESEGRKILTDAESPIILEYIKLEDDPNTWDSGFTEALTGYLASRFAKAFPQDNDKSGREYQEYKEALGEAAAKNGQTGSINRPTASTLTTNVRRY